MHLGVDIARHRRPRSFAAQIALLRLRPSNASQRATGFQAVALAQLTALVGSSWVVAKGGVSRARPCL